MNKNGLLFILQELKIYGETLLFGRGQDNMENIKNLSIKKISDLKYSVLVDFGDNIKTQSQVTLIFENNDFKIDYCVTEFTEDKISDENEIIYRKKSNKSADFIPNKNYEI